jgi:predicted dehydrogenase
MRSSLPSGGRSLDIGIAGYGVVGRIRHRFIDQHPQLRVAAVCDRAFSEPAVLEGGVRAYPSYEELLDQRLDALFVCLPTYLAAEVTIAALERGLHVFCEKPPGRDPAEVVRVRQHEREHQGQKLMYGFNHRYHDSVREALRIVRGGELGELVDLRGVYGKSAIIKFGSSDWRSRRAVAGGGILLDQGIHLVDMVRLFAGDFIEVHSYVSNAYWNHDVEDNAYALMRTDGGVVAMLQSSATQWRHRFNLDITLTRGAIALSGILSNSKTYGAETITVVYAGENDDGDPREQTTRYNVDNSWRDEILDFAEAILEDKDVVSGSSLEALKTIELVYRIYAADEEWAGRYGLEASLPLETRE